MHQANDVKEPLPGRQPSFNFCYLCFSCIISCGTCFIIYTLEYIRLSLNVRYKGFYLLKKSLKNNSENIFLKNSPFAKRKPRAKHIFVHALSRKSQALSNQPLHLRLICSAKLAKVELSQLQFDMNSAKLQPDQ